MAAMARRAGSSLLRGFFLASTPAGRSGANQSLLVCNALSNRDPFRNYSNAPVSKDQNVQHKISEGHEAVPAGQQQQQQKKKTKDKAGDVVDEDEEFTEEDVFEEEEEEEEVRGTPERAAALARSFLETCYRKYGGNDR